MFTSSMTAPIVETDVDVPESNVSQLNETSENSIECITGPSDTFTYNASTEMYLTKDSTALEKIHY